MPKDEFFSQSHKIIPCFTVTQGASAATDITGATIDMNGFEAVVFLISFGGITSGGAQSFKVQRDTDSAMGTAADMVGSKVTVVDTGDDKTYFVEVIRPAERYVRLIVARATQVSTVHAIAILYGARNRPVSQSAAVTGETHIDIGEGTA